MIELVNFRKHYGKRVLFDRLNLSIEENKLTAIIGKSGSGKTTLLNTIGLLDLDYHGDITIMGTHLKSLNASKRNKFIRENINYLFQDFALIESETVEFNLMLALEYTKAKKNEKQRMVHEALTKVGLESLQQEYVYTLSGGEQQRVALARTFIKPGNIILTDEPTGNLDLVNSELVFDLLKGLKQQNKTIVIVTHNLEIARKCDCIIDLSNMNKNSYD